MTKKIRIAFIHYPHGTNSARIETMPFALNSVLSLAKFGCEVDLFLWEKDNSNYFNIFSKNVKIIYNEESSTLPIISRILNKAQIKAPLFSLKFQTYRKYDCVFGLGQIGAYIASIISESCNCPFIYYNDEFPSCWGNSIWSKLEAKVVEKATMIVVPDEQRFLPLSKELNIASIPHFSLPNIPFKTEIDNLNWHSKFNIPPDYIPFLHAGSVADWAQIPEIMTTVPCWNEKTCLIIHTRSSENILKYRQQLSHLDVEGRIFWSLEPMSDTMLNSLVAYCAGNFALYRNLGPNIEYIGFSSGKLMRSLMYGSPVIASQFSSLQFIEDHQLGVLVKHPHNIPQAIEKILNNRDLYSSNCLTFCRKQVSFDEKWTNFFLKFKEITNLELN
ncbi:MAG: glycosyltransferase [Dolichospermum sp.]